MGERQWRTLVFTSRSLLRVAKKAANRTRKLVQDFELLFKLRNSLVHLKPDRADYDTIFGPRNRKKHSVADQLVERGILQAKHADAAGTWVELISAPEVAKWACTAAENIAGAIFEMIPDGSFKRMVWSAWSKGKEPHPEITYIGDRSTVIISR